MAKTRITQQPISDHLVTYVAKALVEKCFIDKQTSQPYEVLRLHIDPAGKQAYMQIRYLKSLRHSQVVSIAEHYDDQEYEPGQLGKVFRKKTKREIEAEQKRAAQIDRGLSILFGMPYPHS